MRRRLSGKARQRFLEEHGRRCHLCPGKIDETREKWEIEHVIPLALGGEDEPENWRPAHAKCHLAKTREDVAQIAKAKRVELRHRGSPQRKSSRPMPGSRASGWRKPMNGPAERR